MPESRALTLGRSTKFLSRPIFIPETRAWKALLINYRHVTAFQWLRAKIIVDIRVAS